MQKDIVDLCIGNINIETGEQMNYCSVDEIQVSCILQSLFMVNISDKCRCIYVLG